MSISRGIKWSLAAGLVFGGGMALLWWLYGSSHALAVAGRAVERQDWPAARRRLQVYLALHPGSGPARLALAEGLVSQSRPEEALAQLRQVPDRDPAGLDARLHEGTVLLSLDRGAQAERAFRAARALAPGAPMAYRGLVMLYLWEDRTAECEPLLWKLYDRVDPQEQPEVLAQLFQLHYGGYPVEQIEPKLHRLIRNDPTDTDAQVALAKFQRRQKKLEDARALLESLRLPPGHLEGRAVLLTCYLNLGDPSRARALLDAWPEAERQDVRYRRALGTYQQAYLQQWDQAAGNFQRVLAAEPDDWETRHQLGECLRMMGRAAEAQRQLNLANQMGHLLAHENLKQLLGPLNAPWSGDPVACAALGRLCEEVGRLREARCWYEQTLAIDPANAAGRDGLSRMARGAGSAGVPPAPEFPPGSAGVPPASSERRSGRDARAPRE